MNIDRKLQLFDALCEKVADGCETDEEMERVFLEIGFTPEEYKEEIAL